MRFALLAILFAVSACAGTEPGPPDDDDNGGGGEPLPPVFDLVRPKNDGSDQEGTVDKTLLQPFVIRVMFNGNPMPGVFVDWAAITPGASMSPATSQTDAYGYTSSYFRPNHTVGVQYGKVVLGEQEELFWITAGPGSPNTIVAVPSVDSAPVDGFLIKRVMVTDQFGNGVPDVPVTWTHSVNGGPLELWESQSLTAGNGAAYFAIWFGTSPATVTLTATSPSIGVPPINIEVKSY